MRVAVVNLTGGGLSGGFRKYIRHLVPRLREDPRLRGLDVFVPPASLAELRETGLEGLLTWGVDEPGRGFPALRAAIRDRKPDVVFIPTARWLAGLGAPQVVMVRNVEPLEQPLAGLDLRGALANLARAHAARRACRRAARVIAVSRHVAGFLTGRWRIGAEKLAIVYHGVDPAPAEPGIQPPAARDLGGRPFLFTAGSLRPARGLQDLVDALARLGASAPPLLVAGAPDPDTEAFFQRLRDSVARRGLSECLRWAGWLGEAEMRWCYRNAAAFVMTSRAESCPNTALEAMAHGCLVLSTNHPPMPEFFAETARYYRARDGADLARQILPLLGADEEEKADLRRAARERSAGFTWAEMAWRTVDVIGTVAQSAPRG